MILYGEELDQCTFAKNAYMINVDKHTNITKKDYTGRNIVFYQVNIPEKYSEYEKELNNFNPSILYESLIFKHTNYKNIKDELTNDGIEIEYLLDSSDKIIKNKNMNSLKKLDKITI